MKRLVIAFVLSVSVMLFANSAAFASAKPGLIKMHPINEYKIAHLSVVS